MVVFDQIGELRSDRFAQRQIRVLERLLDLERTVRALADVVLRIERILDAQDRGSIAIHELLEDLLLGHVRAAVAYPNARFHVVELFAVQLEELDQQHAQIVVRAARIYARMQLYNELN